MLTDSAHKSVNFPLISMVSKNIPQDHFVFTWDCHSLKFSTLIGDYSTGRSCQDWNAEITKTTNPFCATSKWFSGISAVNV